jgi:hypothetical protein
MAGREQKFREKSSPLSVGILFVASLYIVTTVPVYSVLTCGQKLRENSVACFSQSKNCEARETAVASERLRNNIRF